MYGHDLRRVGRLDDAIRQFEDAQMLAERSFAAESDNLQYDWNYRHNLSLLAAAYQQAGKWSAAERTEERLAAMPVNNRGDDSYRKDLAVFLLERERYGDALAAATALLGSDFGVGRASGHAVAGIAQAEMHNLPEARHQLAAAEKELAALPAGWRASVLPWVDILRGAIGLHAADHRPAVARLLQLERDLRLRPGADAWSDALFQLGFIDHLAMESNAWDLAETTAEQLREDAPDYGGTHWALGLVAKHKGDEVTANRELQLAAKAWLYP